MPTSKELKNLDSQIKKTLISSQSFKKQRSFDASKSILGIHKNISSLAGSVRRVVIRVGALEKAVQNNSRKITSLKNISALQGPQIRGNNIGAKLPGSSTRDLDKNISIITDAVSSIAETLKQQYKTDQKTSDYDRRKKEQEKRGLAEGKLEKRFDGIKRLAQKVIAPVKSFLDRILDFFKTVILGRIVYKLVEWLGDPKNASKVKSIIRFVKDWWPALLASYVLFGNSFSGLIRGTLGMVTRFTVQLARVAIPSLLRFISANPVVAGVAAVAGMGVLANEVTGQRKAASVQTENKAKAQTGRGLGVQGVGGVGSMGPTTPYGLLQGAAGGGLLTLKKFSGGGFAEGYVSGERGVDKVPAMLSDGEFVMSVGAVEKYGVDTLEAMNAAGGGTNKPKVVGGKIYAKDGGRISRNYNEDSDAVGNIKRFIKYKIGYDVDKPETWGSSFGGGVGQFFGNKNTSPSSSSSNYNSSNFIPGLLNQGQAIVNQALDPRTYRPGMNIVSKIYDDTMLQGARGYDYVRKGLLPDIGKAKDKSIDSLYNTLFGGMKKGEESKYVTPEKFASLSEKQKLDVLVKDPNNNSQTQSALTLRNEKAYQDQAKYIRGLYDPTKDKGIVGNAKRMYQDVMNRGLIPTGGVPQELDPLIAKLTSGKIKRASAISSAVNMTIKGLLGPLGKPFRVDGSSLLEYNKPLMDFAIKNKLMNAKGEYMVGKESWSKALGDRAYTMVKDPKTGRMVRGEHLYDKMQRESMGSAAAAKFANFGLGQFNFKVGKDGKAIVNDSWDSNNTAGYYFDESKNALKRGDIYNALFKGFSGVLRLNQNTAFGMGNRGFANVNPLGFDTKSRSTFAQALNARPKKGGPVTMYGPNDPRRKQSGPYQSRFARPKNAGVKPVGPPVSKKPRVVYGPPVPSARPARSNNPGATRVPKFTPYTKGTRTRIQTLGLLR